MATHDAQYDTYSMYTYAADVEASAYLAMRHGVPELDRGPVSQAALDPLQRALVEAYEAAVELRHMLERMWRCGRLPVEVGTRPIESDLTDSRDTWVAATS